MKLDRLHEAALHQLTGCRYAAIRALHVALCESIPKTARGRRSSARYGHSSCSP